MKIVSSMQQLASSHPSRRPLAHDDGRDNFPQVADVSLTLRRCHAGPELEDAGDQLVLGVYNLGLTPVVKGP